VVVEKPIRASPSLPDERREDDKRVDYDIKQARELIGGEEAEQLREQFA
jgi:hypothetical protein